MKFLFAIEGLGDAGETLARMICFGVFLLVAIPSATVLLAWTLKARRSVQDGNRETE